MTSTPGEIAIPKKKPAARPTLGDTDLAWAVRTASALAPAQQGFFGTPPTSLPAPIPLPGQAPGGMHRAAPVATHSDGGLNEEDLRLLGDVAQAGPRTVSGIARAAAPGATPRPGAAPSPTPAGPRATSFLSRPPMPGRQQVQTRGGTRPRPGPGGPGGPTAWPASATDAPQTAPTAAQDRPTGEGSPAVAVPLPSDKYGRPVLFAQVAGGQFLKDTPASIDRSDRTAPSTHLPSALGSVPEVRDVADRVDSLYHQGRDVVATLQARYQGSELQEAVGIVAGCAHLPRTADNVKRVEWATKVVVLHASDAALSLVSAVEEAAQGLADQLPEGVKVPMKGAMKAASVVSKVRYFLEKTEAITWQSTRDDIIDGILERGQEVLTPQFFDCLGRGADALQTAAPGLSGSAAGSALSHLATTSPDDLHQAFHDQARRRLEQSVTTAESFVAPHWSRLEQATEPAHKVTDQQRRQAMVFARSNPEALKKMAAQSRAADPVRNSTFLSALAPGGALE